MNPLELVAKLRAATRQPRHILHAEAEEISSRADPLTELANDRCLRLSLERAWRRDWRSRAPISLIVLNIDHFAQFNHLGVATATPGTDQVLDDLVATAERALSEAKLRGRNQFVALEEERAAWPA